MSNVRAASDSLQHAIDLLNSEPDPIRRLAQIKEAEIEAAALMRSAKRAAAYDARQTFSTQDIADAIRSDRHDVVYWVQCHARDNGLPDCTRKKRADLSQYRDLTDA